MRISRLLISFATLLLPALTVSVLISSRAGLAQPGDQRPHPVQGLGPSLDQLLEKIDPLFSRGAPAEGFCALDESGHGAADRPAPADDATIKELIVYWTNPLRRSEGEDPIKPSDIVRRRLLEAAEKRPQLLLQQFCFECSG